ncbi:hypothetical protein SODALDRAFT_363706 [Sodiomyces alkalinus F11]|uniref:Uncharacterized protein n=1 Tax=Sodiomyces alkalinus (strain CBS 110278 / VKM F-3762 / F11) TaxID=1314773 RepID=A0A3N2PKS4_SODAK|nr:hypothetical protein SODALDRAFT_363706 [Sodiomyces alkalinus F11]ROT35014.1 hypothetical protein SODALDRAFT_363706 [Sodiomyces alkalinus F11]
MDAVRKSSLSVTIFHPTAAGTIGTGEDTGDFRRSWVSERQIPSIQECLKTTEFVVVCKASRSIIGWHGFHTAFDMLNS